MGDRLDAVGIEVRKIEPAEVEAFARSVTVPFLDSQDDEDKIGHMTRDVEPDRAWVAVEEGRFVANCCNLTRDVTLPGWQGEPCPTVPLTAVSEVGVHPTHRRRGLLTQMMGELLDDGRRRGEPLAGLVASEGSIYGRFGFAVATEMARWRADPKRTAYVEPMKQADITLATANEVAKMVPKIHDRHRRARAGEVDRHDRWWDETLADPRDKRKGQSQWFFLIAGDGDGYAAYRGEDMSNDRDFGGRVRVHDMYATDPDIEAALWRFVFDLDLVKEVVGERRPVDEPLRWRLKDPRRLRVERVEDGLWMRILDVPKALEARGYERSGSLCFEVVDRPELSPTGTNKANGSDATDEQRVLGKWVLEVDAESTAVDCRRPKAGNHKDKPQLRLGIGALSALLFGGVSARALARAGLIELTGEGQHGAVAEADGLFSTSLAPMSTTGF